MVGVPQQQTSWWHKSLVASKTGNSTTTIHSTVRNIFRASIILISSEYHRVRLSVPTKFDIPVRVYQLSGTKAEAAGWYDGRHMFVACSHATIDVPGPNAKVELGVSMHPPFPSLALILTEDGRLRGNAIIVTPYSSSRSSKFL